MKKIERLISIVMILLSKRTVSASEFSEIFEVTVRTIQRDIDSLIYANIPIYTERGRFGGYSLMESYKFDKRLMTTEDIENILIALGGFEQLNATPELSMTIEKMKSMTLDTPKHDIDFTFYQFSGHEELIEQVFFIKQAIKDKRLLYFTYVDSIGKASSRVIEPYQLKLREMRWYVYGFDLNKADFRTFKLTRMSELSKKENFSAQRELPIPSNQFTQTLVDVKLEVSYKVLDQFIERYGYKVLTKKSEHLYKINISVPQDNFGFQFLAGFGPEIKIIEPKAYIDGFKAFLTSTIEQYG